MKDGGPAFPTLNEVPGVWTTSTGGLSLRDWFAGQAIEQVICIYVASNTCGIGADHLPRNCAAHAYRIADAMIAERDREGE